MTKNYKYPGVYIQEIQALPSSVDAVPTAIPAFIGYTEYASANNKSLENKPTRIKSLLEYHQLFGKGPDIKYHVKKDHAKDFILEEIQGTRYLLYNSLRLFYANGGSTCYIVSVGTYNDEVSKDQLSEGLRALLKEPEPTMLVIPDAVCLDEKGCYGLQRDMLKHCGSEMKNHFTLLDVFDGFKERTFPQPDDVITKFRGRIGNSYLQWGAAYYPWLHTIVIPDSEINFRRNINNPEDLKQLLIEDINKLNIEKQKAKLIKFEISRISDNDVEVEVLHQTLNTVSPLYAEIMKEIRIKMNLLPPGAGMAGVISMVDNNRGVWKAPANVAFGSVFSPTVNISSSAQQDLNVPLDGKAVNAIRSFVGKGVLVWGSRTLDGNSNEWRYINVRRLAIMIEGSIKTSLKAYAFKPNEQKTWLTVEALISNFLTQLWRQGALAGAKTQDAFFVNVGLGTTMTQQDIIAGIMNITVGIAVMKPAEFIVIRFKQKMPKP